MDENKSVQPSVSFQRLLPFLLFVATVWVVIGRGFFGAGGWMFVITFLFYGPVLVGYTIATTIVLHSKAKQGYVMSAKTRWVYSALLLSLFAFGFFLIDGGDTQESVKSAFTALFGVNGATGGGGVVHPLLQASSVLSTISFWSSLVLVVVALVLLVKDKRNVVVDAQNQYGQTNSA